MVHGEDELAALVQIATARGLEVEVEADIGIAQDGEDVLEAALVVPLAPGPGLPEPGFLVDMRTCWCMERPPRAGA